MYYAVRSPRAYRKVYSTNQNANRPTNGTKQNATRPRANVVEGDDYYRILLAVPGIAKSDIHVKVEDEVLHISSEANLNLNEGEKYNHREFKVNAFTRNFVLPETADATRIEAKVENGILGVTIYKKAEAVKQAPRNIDVA